MRNKHVWRVKPIHLHETGNVWTLIFMASKRGVKRKNVHNGGVDIMSSFKKSTPVWVLEDNLEHFSTKAREELAEKCSKLKDVFPACGCNGADDSAWYTQLGSASNLDQLRAIFETRLGVSGDTFRFVQIQLAAAETVIESCPAPKWAITRSKSKEKFIIVYKERRGHVCNNTCIVVGILQFDALDQDLSAKAYSTIQAVTNLTEDIDTKRVCERNCICLTDSSVSGQSFTWGCSTSIFNYLLCKFSRSQQVRQFNLGRNHGELENKLTTLVNQVANAVSAKHKVLALDSFNNMNLFGDEECCRIGSNRIRIKSNEKGGKKIEMKTQK